MRGRWVTISPLFATLVLGAAACTLESSESGHDGARAELEPPAGQIAAPIIHGVGDTTRDAVVSIYSEEGKKALLCTGTIVHVDPTTQVGLVLTAGHCVALTPKYIYIGDDFRARATLRYKVVDSRKHPLYDGGVTSSYDFAFIRFAGADEATPTMPVLSPEQDTLGVDSVVTCVGFGRTTTPPASSDNTTRQTIDRSLTDVDATKLTYSLASGGICNGDSGGPAIVRIGQKEYVAGVHSYVTGNCDGNGVSGRISAAYDWVSAALAEPSPAASCELCDQAASSGNGVCRRMELACLADANCGNYSRCVTSCADDGCRGACQQKYPLGVGPFAAVQQCACQTACTSVCQDSAHCAAVPKCGYAPAAGAAGSGCGACTESGCCAELADCAADGTCYDCLQKQDRGGACAGNAKRIALAQCRERSCAASCDDENAQWAATTSGNISGFAPLGRFSVTRGCAMSPTSAPSSSASGLLAALAAAGLLLRRRRSVR